MTDTVALITALTALCAVLLGPLVSMWSERTRTRVAVLSGNRQAWINELRVLIAQFMSVVYYINSTRQHAEAQSTHNEKKERLLLIHSTIALMVNPNEAEHKDLLAELIKLVTLTLNANIADHQEAMKGALARLTKCSQHVLKSEWERVKRLK